MSFIEAHRLSRRGLLKSSIALALSSCAPYVEEDSTQNGTQGLRANGQPRSGSQIRSETAPLNEPKIFKEIMVPVKSYTSDFRGSDDSRVRNIIIGSNALNDWFWEFDGTRNSNGELNKKGKNLILPGESFSLGSAIEKAKYVEGTMIGRNLRSEKVDGGGICQISTTLNALALTSGLKIEQRKNHDYYNGWYFGDPNDPKEFGMDATVFFPELDWVVTNTFSYPIRLSLEEKDQKLTAKIYSSPELTPFEVDPLEPKMIWPLKGKVKDLGRYTKACQTVLTQRVFVPGNGSMKVLLFEEKFTSNYQTSPFG